MKIVSKIYFCFTLVKTFTLYEAVTGLNQMAQHANKRIYILQLLFKMICWCCGCLIETNSLECDTYL
jgi:hypothetical protein